MALPKLGSGARFATLKGKLGAKGVKDPAALAASIGRKKYGASKMASLSAKGKSSTTSTKKIPTVSKSNHIHIHIHAPQDPAMMDANAMGQRFQNRIQQPKQSHYGNGGM